jgi:hypothetical protein
MIVYISITIQICNAMCTFKSEKYFRKILRKVVLYIKRSFGGKARRKDTAKST